MISIEGGTPGAPCRAIVFRKGGSACAIKRNIGGSIIVGAGLIGNVNEGIHPPFRGRMAVGQFVQISFHVGFLVEMAGAADQVGLAFGIGF